MGGEPQPQQQRPARATGMIATYGCIALWVALSAGVVMLNKYILQRWPFPVALTLSHMLFCSLVSSELVRWAPASSSLSAPPVAADVYVRCVVPVGVLFALSLWWGNAALRLLSVSFVQMLKASTPMLVYAAGLALGTERWSRRTAAVLAAVVAGVLLATAGEVVAVPLGVLLQAASLGAEALRLTLVQLLLQARGVRLTPITTMREVAPVCCVALLVPFAVLEAEPLLRGAFAGAAAGGAGAAGGGYAGVGPLVLLASAAAAFALNCAAFLLIGRTSALTLNFAGVAKDVLLIAASMALFGSVVTELQVVGYGIALCGVACHNAGRLAAQQAAAAKAAAGKSDGCGGGGGGGGARKAAACSGRDGDDDDDEEAAREGETIKAGRAEEGDEREHEQQSHHEAASPPRQPSRPPLKVQLQQCGKQR